MFSITRTLFGAFDAIGFSFHAVGRAAMLAAVLAGILAAVLCSLKWKNKLFFKAGLALAFWLLCELLLVRLCWKLPPDSSDFFGVLAVTAGSAALGCGLAFLVMGCLARYLPQKTVSLKSE